LEHQFTFYPVGNGDTSLLKLDNNKWILFDYYHQGQGEEDNSPVINLKQKLKDELTSNSRDYFDVVAFTHADNDHIKGCSDFFEFDHADKYTGNGRIKIKELWVPAAMILETGLDGDDDRVIRQEARYRLKKGYGISVFSKPDELKKYLEDNDLTIEDRRKFIVDAGETVQAFSLASDGVEFFCHAPFIEQIDDEKEYRNNASLILHATFNCDGIESRAFIMGDADWDYLEKVYQKTYQRGRTNRLDWNLFYISHHCSYKALSDVKGDKETIPKPDVKKLLEHGQADSYMVASCKSIENNSDAYNQEQPPHIQAKNCYEKILDSVNGRKMIITMENNNKITPRPVSFKFNYAGCTLMTILASSTSVAESSPSRAGGVNGI
jgi:hypothetical protein